MVLASGHQKCYSRTPLSRFNLERDLLDGSQALFSRTLLTDKELKISTLKALHDNLNMQGRTQLEDQISPLNETPKHTLSIADVLQPSYLGVVRSSSAPIERSDPLP